MKLNLRTITKSSFAVVLVLTAALGYINILPVSASSVSPLPESDPDSDLCLVCHNRPDQTMIMPSGEVLSITIRESKYSESLHGKLECSECHPGLEVYPHPEQSAQSLREYSIKYHDSCKGCHPGQFNAVSTSIHEQLFFQGNEETPLCADCHQPHSQVHLFKEDEVATFDDRIWITETCAECHPELYDVYANSVHGIGLLEDQNPDMPTCIDCHNVHDICDPTKAEFRTHSLDTCAKCHTDPNIMEKYDKSVNVLNTYLVFHDTTVTMLEKYDPEVLSNKPTCYDCHGIHNVDNMSNPPEKVFEMPGADLYPSVEKEEEPAKPANIAFTGAMVGLLLGGAGTLTISQLVKERKNGVETDD